MTHKTEIKYYIVYNFNKGIGCCSIIFNKKIESYEDIKCIADYISKKCCNNSKVVITNWKKLK